MAEPPLGTRLSDRLDGRYRIQGARELQGHQQDRLCGRRPAQGREERSARPLARQERILRLLDVRAHRYEGPWHRGHPYHGHRQPERFYRYHQERVPRVPDTDMRGTPDPQRLQVRGMEGQEGVHGGYEAYLQCPDPKGGKGRPGGLRQTMGREVLLRDKELEGQLGRTYSVLRVPLGDKKDHLYHQPYREPEREDQEVHQEQAVLPDRRCGDEIRIFGNEGGHQEVVHAHQELGHYTKPVPHDL